jgi:hypothetical protein
MTYYIRDGAGQYLNVDGWHSNPCPVTSVPDLIRVLQLQQEKYAHIHIEITTNYC